ncbi:CLUMA_CG012530, isoform A [Clunio marinus]|uniref:CLUMA_CG012530, isoform A n=1 Tax=Clunio marinus TaxID=568069 RepID=A0A1J1IFX7_9DIPT|nr:CLUMA_CG012530, isoform A [Clunio marinus]
MAEGTLWRVDFIFVKPKHFSFAKLNHSKTTTDFIIKLRCPKFKFPRRFCITFSQKIISKKNSDERLRGMKNGSNVNKERKELKLFHFEIFFMLCYFSGYSWTSNRQQRSA